MGCYIRHIFVQICWIYFCIQFIEISNCSELFLNNTNYCHLDIFSTVKLGPKKEIEFDVFRLNKRVWFNIPFIKDGSNYTFHFSLCRPADGGQLLSPCTERNSLACLSRHEGDTRIEVVHNAGTRLSGFTYDDHQLHLSLVKSSEKCPEGDVYQTVLKISCSKLDQDPILHAHDSCTFVVLWNHSAACPIQDTGFQKACIFEYLGNRYDFRPLRHKSFYYAKKKKKNYSHEFQINICGQINGGKCRESNVSICELNSDNGTAIAVSNTKMVYITKENLGFVLQYLDEAGNVKAEVHFQCKNSLMNHKFNLVGYTLNAKVHVFKIQTSIACLMDAYSHCFISSTDDDNSFSLDTLRNEYENHIIDGYKEGIKYIVNFCGPLVEKKQYDCDGLICMWDLSTNASLIVGTQVLPLKIVEDKTSLIYEIVGGDYCPQEGTHRAVFTLVCHYIEQPPQFTGWQTDCTHSFVWKTPAACPYKHAEAEECKINLKTLGLSFDLTPIRKTTKDYKVTKDKDIFYMNLCGPMNIPCGKTNTSSVCWSQGGAEAIAIGHYKGRQPEYFNGQIFLSMDGDACKTNGPNKSHVTILFTLEMDSNKTLLPHLFMMDLDHCFFYFLWPIQYSWKPQHKSDVCLATDHKTNHTYDLRPLTRTNSNYLIKYNPNGDNGIFIMNVCQPIVPGPEILCKYETGVCLFNRSQTSISKERYLSLGDVGWPFFKDDILRIQYKFGSVLCPFKLDTYSQYTTIIDFICDPNIEDSEPKLIEVKLCQFKFVWQTKSACPIKPPRELLLTNESVQDDEQSIKCSVLTPGGDFRIDLRPLMDDDYDVQTNRGLLKFAVCRSLKCSLRDSEAGACLNGVNTGIASSKLKYHKGVISIEYKNGEPCENKTFSTIIQFICNPNEPLARPEIVSLSDKCTFFIRWETPLVCERKQIGCVAVGDNPDYTFDLSPLIANNKNYQLKVGNNIFFINVCRPLLVVDSLICPGGSSVCRTNLKNGTYADTVSLGHLTTSPEVAVDKSIWLSYSQGDSCDEKSHKMYSTIIKFLCDFNIGIGKPRIQTVSNCEYIFEWKTSYACVDRKNLFNSQHCTIYDSEDNKIMNLSSDIYKRAFKVTSVKGSRYKFQLCSSSGDSQDFLFRGIGTHEWYNLGTPDDVVFHYPENSTLIKIRKGTKCTDKEYFYVEVTLKCDQHYNPHTSKPYVRLESACAVFIEWANWDFCYHNIHGPDVITGDSVLTMFTVDPVDVLPDLPKKVTDSTTLAKTTVTDSITLSKTTVYSITVAKKTMADSQPTSVTDSPVTTSIKPTTTDQGTSHTLFIFGILVVITILIIFLAIIRYIIKKKRDLEGVEGQVSFTMGNASSPGRNNSPYTRDLLSEDEGSNSREK